MNKIGKKTEVKKISRQDMKEIELKEKKRLIFT
jgi:hypothetical protein